MKRGTFVLDDTEVNTPVFTDEFFAKLQEEERREQEKAATVPSGMGIPSEQSEPKPARKPEKSAA